MTHAHDSIQVGAVRLVYSVLRRGWLTPKGGVVRNPIKAQRIAEALNNQLRKVAA